MQMTFSFTLITTHWLLTASTLISGQQSRNKACCYTELAGSSLVVAQITASILCAHPRDGQAELAWMAGLNTSETVIHPSINWAGQRVTASMCVMLLLLSQTVSVVILCQHRQTDSRQRCRPLLIL